MRHTSLGYVVAAESQSRVDKLRYLTNQYPRGNLLDMKLNNLVGQRFVRLVVVERAENNSLGQATWDCQCDCGVRVIVEAHSLRRNLTKSCGCLRSESSSVRFYKHGHSGPKTPEYNTWRGMKSRCNNKHADNFSRYGGRGISVCARWHTFANFLADVGKKPSSDCTLDRINNGGNYEPGNCRWATKSEQQQNKRKLA